MANKVCDPIFKKTQYGVAIPKWLIDWIDNKSKNEHIKKVAIIEEALISHYNLTPPKKTSD